jgi:uncharacterized lipoprotein YmbA
VSITRRRLLKVYALLCCLPLAACASKPDHFYTLNASSAAPGGRAPTLHVRLDVTIPSVVDRAEMVLNTSPNGLSVLDHERWGAPLADQVAQTLARDIEARRTDIFIGDRSFDQPASPPILMKVDLVRMSAQPGGRAGLEAHWRIVDPVALSGTGTDQLGSGTFEAAVHGDGYAAVAEAYSQSLSALADRLVRDLRPR